MKLSDIKKKSASYADGRLRAYLESLPDDEYVQWTELTKRGRFGGNTVNLYRADLIRDGYCFEVRDARRQVFYGNRKAIAALKALPQP
jgi:hypothetical protein